MDIHDSVLVGCELSKLLRSAAVNVGVDDACVQTEEKESHPCWGSVISMTRAQSDTAWCGSVALTIVKA